MHNTRPLMVLGLLLLGGPLYLAWACFVGWWVGKHYGPPMGPAIVIFGALAPLWLVGAAVFVRAVFRRSTP